MFKVCQVRVWWVRVLFRAGVRARSGHGTSGHGLVGMVNGWTQ